MEKLHKTTLAEKLGYGLGELPGTMNAILAAVLTMFYTDSVGLAAGMVGTMFFVSRLFDGVSDLLAGSLIAASDDTGWPQPRRAGKIFSDLWSVWHDSWNFRDLPVLIRIRRGYEGVEDHFHRLRYHHYGA